MAEWDGKDRRQYAELREVIREEIQPLKDNQDTIQAKIAEWEAAAKWLRYFVIGTVAFVSAAIKVYEWTKDNLK